MASTLGNDLYYDSYNITRPRSAIHFRDVHDFQTPASTPDQNLALVPYATGPNSYHSARGGLAASYYYDTSPSQIQYEAAPTNVYVDLSSYPGDLATSHEWAQSDRSLWSEVLKHNTIPINPVLKPVIEAGKTVVEGIGEVVTILASPFVGVFITDAYLTPMENQLNEYGRAKGLPGWLKDFLTSQYMKIDLTYVRYGENIQMKTLRTTLQ